MTSVAVIHANSIIRATLAGWIDFCPSYRCACTAATGKEALREIPQSRPSVVLMDIDLPGESGTTCLARLKRSMPGLEVIVVTMSTDSDSIRQAFRAGASGYLLQGCGREKVLEAIAKVLAGGVPMTPQIARRVIAFFQTPADGKPGYMAMSRREMEVIDLLSTGLSNKDIAEQMGITYETVCVHLRRVYKKLHVHTRAGAVVEYLRVRSGCCDIPQPLSPSHS